MTTIDEDQLRGLRDKLPPGPIRSYTEIQSRAQSLRRRRWVERGVWVAMAGTLVLVAVAVVAPGRQPVSGPIASTSAGSDASAEADADDVVCTASTVDADEVPDDARYLVAPSVSAPPLTDWHAAIAPCGEGDPHVYAATAVIEHDDGGFGVIRISGPPGAGPFAPVSADQMTDIEIRGGPGELHRPADVGAREADVLNASWQEDGEYWTAHATGVSEAELLTTLESLEFDGESVVEWALPPEYDVTLDTEPSLPGPTWRTNAVYGDPEEPGGFYVEVRDRDPQPLVPWGNSKSIEIHGNDSTADGAGYVRREHTGVTWLSWKASGGRTFELVGRITRAEALRLAESLERVEPDDPRFEAREPELKGPGMRERAVVTRCRECR